MHQISTKCSLVCFVAFGLLSARPSLFHFASIFHVPSFGLGLTSRGMRHRGIPRGSTLCTLRLRPHLLLRLLPHLLPLQRVLLRLPPRLTSRLSQGTLPLLLSLTVYFQPLPLPLPRSICTLASTTILWRLRPLTPPRSPLQFALPSTVPALHSSPTKTPTMGLMMYI